MPIHKSTRISTHVSANALTRGYAHGYRCADKHTYTHAHKRVGLYFYANLYMNNQVCVVMNKLMWTLMTEMKMSARSAIPKAHACTVEPEQANTGNHAHSHKLLNGA